MANKKNNKLLLFDYDGTLVDSSEMIIDGTREAFKRCGLQPPEPSKIKSEIGKNLEKAISSYLPPNQITMLDKIAHKYREWYTETDIEGKKFEPLFEKIKQTLQTFVRNGWILGVATNKSSRGLDRGLEYHKIQEFFSITMTADKFPPKPNNAMAIYALEKLKVEKTNAYMIGDTVHDIEMGKNAGIGTIGVNWGYNTEKQLVKSNADYIVNNLDELIQILKDR